MKKFLLASLVAMTLLLPALNNTSNAASHQKARIVDTNIIDWVLFATSDTTDGEIIKIEVYRISTGQKVAAQNCGGGYDCNINLKGLPHGGYSAIIFCQNVTVSKQIKL